VLTDAVVERLKELLHEKAAELHCTVKALEVMPDGAARRREASSPSPVRGLPADACPSAGM
jgi:hypothetical protein